MRDAKRSLTSTEDQNAASLASAKQNVASAQLALEDAQRTHDTAIAPADAATIAADTAAVASAEQTLASAQQALAGTDITAPSDGVITSIDLVVGAAAPNGDAIQFQAGPMQVTASFTESDLTALKAGQPAKVTVSAIDADLTGTLSSIDPVASTSGASSVVSYDATVTIADAPDTIRAGMSADVSVTTASQSGAIAVPIAALVGRNGNYSVRTLDSSGAEQLTPVEVGLVTDTTRRRSPAASPTGRPSSRAPSAPSRRAPAVGTQGGFGGLGGLTGSRRRIPDRRRRHPQDHPMSALMLESPASPGTAWDVMDQPPPDVTDPHRHRRTCGGSITWARSWSRRSAASACRSTRASSWPSSARPARASRRS